MPKTCPICKDPVLNKFRDKPAPRSFELEKTCCSKPDHLFYCASKKADDTQAYVVSVTFNSARTKVALWNIENKSLWITNTDPSNKILIPYIEPDFSDYRKLCQKLKTYLLFS